MRRNQSAQQKASAKHLRQVQTIPEGLLWMRLRKFRNEGFHFRRQHPINNYVADFACIKSKLVIELDGRSHIDREHEDAMRQSAIETSGWRVLRIQNDDVIHNLDSAADFILDWCKSQKENL